MKFLPFPAVVSVMLLVGCDTVPKQSYVHAEMKDGAAAKATVDDREKLDTNYNNAFSVCVDKGKRLEARGLNQARLNLTVSTVGIIAGSVIVPALAAKAAAKSLIAGFGGVSGAANAYQYSSNQNGLSASQTSAIYAAMTAKMQAAMRAYVDANYDINAANKAISDLNFACQFPVSAEITAAVEVQLPKPPQKIEFLADQPDGTSGIIRITPPAIGSGQISDYIVSVSPETNREPLNATDYQNPTIKLLSLTKGISYTVVVRSKNSTGEGLPAILKFTP
jgi:hypothetical protein